MDFLLWLPLSSCHKCTFNKPILTYDPLYTDTNTLILMHRYSICASHNNGNNKGNDAVLVMRLLLRSSAHEWSGGLNNEKFSELYKRSANNEN